MGPTGHLPSLQRHPRVLRERSRRGAVAKTCTTRDAAVTAARRSTGVVPGNGGSSAPASGRCAPVHVARRCAARAARAWIAPEGNSSA